MTYTDTPAHQYFPGNERTAEYREGIYIGYRYYDTAGVPVRFPFGHGLGYTFFASSDVEATPDEVTFIPTLANIVNIVLQVVVSFPVMKFWIMPTRKLMLILPNERKSS